jgi:hypothetical protein
MLRFRLSGVCDRQVIPICGGVLDTTQSDKVCPILTAVFPHCDSHATGEKLLKFKSHHSILLPEERVMVMVF